MTASLDYEFADHHHGRLGEYQSSLGDCIGFRRAALMILSSCQFPSQLQLKLSPDVGGKVLRICRGKRWREIQAWTITPKLAHLRENLWAADFEFTPDELSRLTKAVSKITVVADRYAGCSANQIKK